MRTKPITRRQAETIGRLMPQIGVERYRELKRQTDIPIETTIMSLTRFQAFRLIDRMLGEVNQ